MVKRILFLYGLVIVLGILVGTVGSGFQLMSDRLGPRLLHLYQALGEYVGTLVSMVMSIGMVSIAWWLVKAIAPEASGSGIPEIEGALLHQRPTFWRRLLPVKFFGGVLALSANMVMGREGPTIQIGGNLGEMLGEWFGMSRRRRDTLIAAGAAAGLATAFNAPLAGVIFVIEEMRHAFNFSFTNFKMVAICCVAATIVQHLIIGSQPAIAMAVFMTPSLKSLVLFFIFGIVVGFAGLLFNVMLVKQLSMITSLSVRQRWIYVMLVGGMVGLLVCFYPQTVGGGYAIIEQALTLRPTLTVLVLLMLVRFVTTLLCYSTGVPGGIFAPMLALGTLLGLACSYLMKGWLDPSVHPGMFAVAGMGALFSAAVRAPLTGIVLVVEMTQNYSLIFPLMVSCLTSTTVVQLFANPPIYSQLLHRALREK
jgi:CIC family chloride channel protein